MMMMMYTLWGGCSPPLLPSLELFPREKISLSIPLEVFSPLGTRSRTLEKAGRTPPDEDDDGDDNDDIEDDVDDDENRDDYS